MNYNINKQQILKMLHNNNVVQPKAKYSNNIVIAMALQLEESDYIIVESSNGSNVMFNRGTAGEIVAKILIHRDLGLEIFHTKSPQKVADLDTTKNPNQAKKLGLPRSKNIEIKVASSFAKGSTLSNNARYVLVLNQVGPWLVDRKNVATSKSGHVLPNQPDGVYLEELAKLLGYK